MRNNTLLLLVCCLLGGCNDPEPRMLEKVGHELSTEGWKGTQLREGGVVISEEWDAVGNDGRIDTWRYFDHGKMLSEERDINGDSLVDFRLECDLESGDPRLLQIDTNLDGKFDLIFEYDGTGSWKQSLDRNHDGKPDRELVLRGRSSLLKDTDCDWFAQKDLAEVFPASIWYERSEDEDCDGKFDTWVRYANSMPVYVGLDENGDGKPDAWKRIETKAPAPETAPVATEPAPAEPTNSDRPTAEADSAVVTSEELKEALEEQ